MRRLARIRDDTLAAGCAFGLEFPVIVMMLLDALDAFYLEHRRCGELDSEVTEADPGWVVMACSCGAQIARRITGSDDPPRHTP